MIDYLRLAQEYHGSRNDGFLTDVPISTKLAEDDIVKVRYDAKAMRWIANRPAKITYPTARQLIREYRLERAVALPRLKEYAERLR